MKAKVVQDSDVVTYVAVCDPGDEAIAALTEFARTEGLEASQVTAVGAFERTGPRAAATSSRDGCSRRWRASSPRARRSCARWHGPN
jgi:hypothetical protein